MLMEQTDHCHRCLRAFNAASRRFFRGKVVASGRSQRRFCGEGGRALPSTHCLTTGLNPMPACLIMPAHNSRPQADFHAGHVTRAPTAAQVLERLVDKIIRQCFPA